MTESLFQNGSENELRQDLFSCCLSVYEPKEAIASRWISI